MHLVKKKYVLYLQWFEAERFYYQYRNKIQIEYCIADLNGTYPLDTFHDIPVLRLDVLKIKEGNELIVVCEEDYFEVKKYLLRMGLCEFQHFIPSALLDRQMVIVHGNCYMNPLIEYLMKMQEFQEKYYIYPIPLICCNSEHEISENLLQRCDVFIHQNIHTKIYGEKLTDKWIISRLSQQCRIITIPNFMGIYRGGVFFYPQCIATAFRRRLLIQNHNFCGCTDYYIEDCYRTGMSGEEIVRRIKNTEIFDKAFVETVFDNSMLDLLKREQEWDVKISDYFLETYRMQQFFLDPGHPADHVIKEIAVRIVGKLGILIDKTGIKDLGKEMLNWAEIPTYQCVKDILGLKWKDNYELREGSTLKLTPKQMNIAEYIKEYIYFSEYAERCVNQYNKKIFSEWREQSRLIIFGAGHWFEDYMRHYGTEYMPDSIVDNDMGKWGYAIHGIIVESPQKIQSEDRVIICCCGAEEDIVRQVLAMGVKDIILYRPDRFVERVNLRESDLEAMKNEK